MRCLSRVFFVLVLTSCQNILVDLESSRIKGVFFKVKACSEVQGAHYILPKIRIKSIPPNYTEVPYNIELEDASESTHPIVSWRWEIFDVRDLVVDPVLATCAAEPDCRYRGETPPSTSEPILKLLNIGTSVSMGGADDFLVRLTVKNSIGLEAVASVFYYGTDLSNSIDAFEVETFTTEECALSMRAQNLVLHDLGTPFQPDGVALDYTGDGVYEEERSSVTFPQDFSYSVLRGGQHSVSFVFKQAAFDPAAPYWDRTFIVKVPLVLY